jgi:hypothetical protein
MSTKLVFKESRRKYGAYLPLTEEQGKLFKDRRTDLEVYVSYTLGGQNYFTGGYNKRGYKLFFNPVAINGNFTSSTLLGDSFESGFYVNIEEANRYSAKRLGELAALMEPLLDRFLALYLEKNPGQIAALVKGAVPPEGRSTPPAPAKNLCAKTVTRDKAYEVWQSGDGSWTWYVLKKYQAPEAEAKNEYARWFCDVVTPIVPQGEMGDVYVKDITQYARRIK